MTKTVFRVLGVVASLAVGGAAVAADSPAIEWKVSDGGNGHWYKLVIAPNTVSWNYADAAAALLSAHLATLTSANENAFVFAVANQPGAWGSAGPWLGAFRDSGTSAWHWVTGETWSWTNWLPPNPDGPGYWNENRLSFATNYSSQWNDFNESGSQPCCKVVSYVLEFDADCNGDGSVDYGQIQSGELADTNHNGVPDVCDPRVTYVQPISGPSTGSTAVKINGNNFPISPIVTFGGVAATEIVRVSPSLITAVTPAGTPGMTMVAVNSASSESFYYRPSCDGDLDNNGTIDSSDLGLVLLGFGSCSESLTTPQPEPMIFQTAEIATPVLNKK